MSKKLHVVKMTTDQLRENWGMKPIKWPYDSEIRYVRSNSNGVINWENTVAYRPEELVGRDNVRVVEKAVTMQVKKPVFKDDEKL